MLKNLKADQFSLSNGLPLLAVFICLGIFLARAIAVLNFHQPMHIVTSGFEEESLFALWKYANDQPVYQDPHQIPFAASYFNWLFYGVYGEVIRLFNLDAKWLPTIARSITLGFVLLGFGCCLAWFRQKGKVAGLALSTIVVASPLIGFWALTSRPDVPAFCLEIAACTLFFTMKDKKPLTALLAFILFSYFAWSFKQINVVAPGALGLYFLLSRQLTSLAVLTIGYFGLIGATIWLAPPEMAAAVLFQDTSLKFSVQVWFDNLSKAILKTLPLWIMASVLAFSRLKHWWHNPQTRFALCGLLVWAIVLLPASSKIGSADNYHFIAVLFLALLVLEGWSSAVKSKQLAWGAYSAVLVLTLVTGQMKLSMQPMHQYHSQVAACLSQVDGPLFINNHYLSLPWMTRGPHYFVTAYNYHADRWKGYDYQYGGIGGLIKSGYFKYLAFPQNVKTFDGADLGQYQPQAVCEDMVLYRLG